MSSHLVFIPFLHESRFLIGKSAQPQPMAGALLRARRAGARSARTEQDRPWSPPGRLGVGGAPASAGAFHLQGDGGGQTQGGAPQSRTPRGEKDRRTRSKRFSFHVHCVLALLPLQHGGTGRSVFADPTPHPPLAEVRRPSAMPGAAARSRCPWDYISRHALRSGWARPRGPAVLAGGRCSGAPTVRGGCDTAGWYRRGAIAHEGGNTQATPATPSSDGTAGPVRSQRLCEGPRSFPLSAVAPAGTAARSPSQPGGHRAMLKDPGISPGSAPCSGQAQQAPKCSLSASIRSRLRN